ncbi:MAG: DedA family protein [Oligoflexia bacterium]|nr:DedA family protein [Oligoflexia bacterium]
MHELVRIWFGWVEHWGYWGVFALMALESTVVPVPSEVVIPPAAFWASQSQGGMSFFGVILIGTAGSYLGSIINYWVSRWVGQPVVNRYGKYFLLSREKLLLSEAFVCRFGAPGIFVSRLLPVIRHLISIPAGVLRMPFGAFSVSTVIGAGLWCTVLAWFGQEVIGGHPELLQSPEQMMRVIKARLLWFVVAALVLAILYIGVIVYGKKVTANPQL